MKSVKVRALAYCNYNELFGLTRVKVKTLEPRTVGGALEDPVDDVIGVLENAIINEAWKEDESADIRFW